MLRFESFAGMRPSGGSLRDEHADFVLDANLERGTLKPWRSNLPVNMQENVLSMYETPCCMVTSTQCYDYAQGSPECGGRVFRTGQGKPKTAVDADACADKWCNLGFPCDMPAPTLAASNLPTDEGELQPTAVVYTMVNQYGEESQPSPPSNAVLGSYSTILEVAGIPPCPAGYCVKEIRIYALRSGFVAGSEQSNANDTAFFYAQTISCGTPSVIFELGSPGDMMTTIDYSPPPDDLWGIASWKTGQLAGIAENKLCFSIRNMPHAWPEDARMRFYGKALSHKAAVNHGYVLTDGKPFVVQLQDKCQGPRCHRGDHVDAPPCVSAKSAAVWGDSVVYATRHGLQMLNGFSPKELNFWDTSSWQALRPDTMIGAVHDGCYFGFTSVAAFRLNLSGDPRTALTMLSERPTAVLAGTDRLYLAEAGGVTRWNEGYTFDTAVWERSNLKHPTVAYAAAQVYGADASVELSTGCGGEQSQQFDLSHCQPKRIKPYRSNNHSVIIKTSGEVSRLDIAAGKSELSA